MDLTFTTILCFQVIYTKSNGRIVVEVWENGERLRDVEEVIFDSDEVFVEEDKESVQDDKGQDVSKSDNFTQSLSVSS